jgi:glutathione peroxidase
MRYIGFTKLNCAQLIILEQRVLDSGSNNILGGNFMSVYEFSAQTTSGSEKSLADYKGKVLVIVNTASKCGLTPQYEGLQKLRDKFQQQNFEVLGFPSNQFMNQEPGSDADIQQFCQINYGVTFPVFRKINVNGSQAHPLFKYLRKKTRGFFTNHIKWNFTKFLINSQGEVVKRYKPTVKPEEMENDIKRLLQAEVK